MPSKPAKKTSKTVKTQNTGIENDNNEVWKLIHGKKSEREIAVVDTDFENERLSR